LWQLTAKEGMYTKEAKINRLQYKLIRTLLSTSTLPLIIVACVTVFLLGRMAVNDAQQRIDSSLNTALSIYQIVQDDLKYIARDQNRRIFTLMQENQLDLLRNEYKKIVEKNKLDFFVITDRGGRVIVSMSNPQFEGYSYNHDFFVRQALKGQITVSPEVLMQGDLEKLGLLEKAKIPGVRETQGLVIRATIPVINTKEILVGTLSAGYLLNNNNAVIIDKITKNTELVSSIFLGDVRVCSNVPSRDKENAVGSKLEGKAATYIFNVGKNYIGRMQLSGMRYLAGYVPLRDIKSNIIGILGIGIPEKCIFALRDKLINIFFLAAFFSTALALIFGLLKGESIVKSIDKLRKGIEAFSRDDFNHRITIHSKDEIEELANFFNKIMAQLKTARKKLTEHEKMVAMGRMATAISHGLKNTFAEIQTSADYLKNKTDKDSPELAAVLKDIENSIIYATDVLNHILRFSHPKEPLLVDVDINLIIEDALSSAELRRSLENNKIELIKDLDSSIPTIKADGIQIKEAILNLVNNAVEAMPAGGKLSIITKRLPDSLILKVIDTGGGIPKETTDNLFTPFFSTKGRGLGLGLCISREIIEAHQGNIAVNTEINKGTTFIVTLPLKKLA